MLEESHCYFHKAANVLGLPANVKEILLTPHRVVKVDLVTEGEDGRLMHHLGFRVQHNNVRGTVQGWSAVSPDGRRRPRYGAREPDDLENSHRRCSIRRREGGN